MILLCNVFKNPIIECDRFTTTGDFNAKNDLDDLDFEEWNEQRKAELENAFSKLLYCIRAYNFGNAEQVIYDVRKKNGEIYNSDDGDLRQEFVQIVDDFVEDDRF